MFPLVFDNRFQIYLVLGIAAVVLAMIWLRTRDRRIRISLFVVVGLLGVFLLVDKLRPETVREQIERKIKEMAAAVEAQKPDRIFEHISEEFSIGPADKATLRDLAKRVMDCGELT